MTRSGELRGQCCAVGFGQLVVVRDGQLPVRHGSHRIAGELFDERAVGALPGPGTGELLDVAR